MIRPFLCTAILATATAASAQGDGSPFVRLGLSNAIGSMTSEATVDLSTGLPGNDALDVPVFTDDAAPTMYIATLAPDGTPLAYNAHGPYDYQVMLPVQLVVDETGVYRLTMLGLGNLPATTCVSLLDLETGESTILGEDLEIAVALEAGVLPLPRYKLRVDLPTRVVVTDALCPYWSEGAAVAFGTGNGPWNVTWYDPTGQPVATQTGQTDPVLQTGLYLGEWSVAVENLDGCGTYTVPFVIGAPEPIAIDAQSEPSSCYSDAADGRIGIAVSGGTAPYTFAWSNGSTAEDLEQASPGIHSVTVTDANGCTQNSGDLVVDQLPQVAGTILGPATATQYQPVQFSSDAAAGVQRTWNLGDGTTSTQPAPQHAYQQPGSYTVTLVLDNGDCQTQVQHAVQVLQNSVGVNELDGTEVRAWGHGGGINISNPLNVGLHVHVYDATGRTVHTMRIPARTGRVELSTTGWTHGVYYLNASSPWDQWTFSLPVTE